MKFRPAITEGGQLHDYLHGTLGFDKSLAGRSLMDGKEPAAEDEGDGVDEATA